MCNDDRNVKKETKKKILDLAERMEYTRNELAVNLRKQSTDLCMLVHPSVTVVEQPVKKMAEEAVRLIVEKLECPEKADETVILDAETCFRESTC